MGRRFTHGLQLAVALAGLLTTAAGAALPAQGIDWSIAGGQTLATGPHDHSWSRDGRAVSGATGGDGHAALAGTWMVPGWSLGVRGELLYNRLSSPPNSYCGASVAQCARRDETLAASAIAEFRARRGRGWTPYLLLGAGLHRNRIGVAEDPASEPVVATYTTVAPGVSAGVGLSVPIGRIALLAELRHFQTLHRQRGSAFMPISFGVRF